MTTTATRYHLKRHLLEQTSVKLKDNLWIIKPASDSCGRGISVVSKSMLLKKWSEYADPERDKGLLVQRYCARPSLIDGVKFDVRLYVVIVTTRCAVALLSRLHTRYIMTFTQRRG